MATNNEIMGLLRDMSAKMDHLVDRVAKVETAVEVDVATTAQTRDVYDQRMTNTERVLLERISAIEQTIQKDVLPQTDDMKRMKLVGTGIVGIIALGGVSVGAAAIWFGEQLAGLLRHLLRLS